MDFITDSPAAFWFILGFALLALEALVLSFSTGVVLFTGLGALITGGLIWTGVLAPTMLAGVASFGLSSILITGLLWKPLKKMQDNSNTVATKDTSSDFIGYEFRVLETVTHTEPGKTRYSGIEWRVEIDDNAQCDTITKGKKVKVTSVDAGIFRVVPVESSTG